MDKVEETSIKMDKQRSGYYNYYTSRKWGDLRNYHLSIDTGFFGIDGAVDLIIRAVESSAK